ncbi:LacI family DNA-binding transcriptional regulator [Rhizobium leguminosarum]|uniref:LacI family DNA-binding transcriptional regulator n=1 Tax=Rhizobium leguminosarum TaxID=384 RepID=UPI0021BBD38F|nr:LacI family DNA-binding transcriptional regulator [Rhizobium leguminosarum]
MTDVAREANVSAITVSRALRQPDIVSPEVRVRVKDAVDRLGYVPDLAARALASARTDIIGVVIPSVTNNVFADVLRGAYSAAEASPFRLQLGNTRYSPIEEERLLRVFLSQKPAGLLVTGLDQAAASLGLLKTADCPIVQIMEYGDSPVDMLIGLSHREAARTATRHLIESGYRRVAFLGARMDPRTQRRLEGFRDAARVAGLLDERLIVTTPQASTVGLGGDLLGALLAQAPDADAVFCNNDDLALGALFECQRRRISVPHEFGICGFNDLEPAAAAFPSITSVRTFREAMGRQAVEMLLTRISGAPVVNAKIDIGFELIRRESTRRFEPAVTQESL